MTLATGGIAVVTGAAGQDGSFLVERLISEGMSVHATVRRLSSASRIDGLSESGRLTIHRVDAEDANGYGQLISATQPDEVYNCAGQSSVSESFRDPVTTWRSNTDVVMGMLEAIRLHSPGTRFYQASSTDMFGTLPGGETLFDERSQFRPQSPYAAAKAAAHLLCDAYRRSFDLRVACGILSNHESRRRPASFLTSKVTSHVRSLAVSSAAGRAPVPPLRVGNLAVRREWGYAPDYVDGIIRICRQVAVRADASGTKAEADVGSNYRDYVLGTGHAFAVWELVDRAFLLGGFPLEWDRSSPDPADWTARLAGTGVAAVVVDRSLIRQSDPAAIGTNPSRARDELAWRPRPDLDAFLLDMLAGEVTEQVEGRLSFDDGMRTTIEDDEHHPDGR